MSLSSAQMERMWKSFSSWGSSPEKSVAEAVSEEAVSDEAVSEEAVLLSDVASEVDEDVLPQPLMTAIAMTAPMRTASAFFFIKYPLIVVFPCANCT